MLSVHHISEILTRLAALPVHQVAILDFLNRAKTAEDIAGVPGSSTSPIQDDPNRFAGKSASGKGYDIGLKVAQRILDKRRELGGKFASLDQLARIPYFGEDKFNDLVYTFVVRRSPVPTGMGIEFDEYISAMAALELSQLSESNQKVLSALRKLNLDTATASEPNSNMNWDDVIQGAEDVKIPSLWNTAEQEKRSAGKLRQLTSMKVKSDYLNPPVLLAGLDAQNYPGAVRSTTLPVQINSNLESATFLQGIGNATFQYISQEGAGQLQIDSGKLLQAYLKAYPVGALMASADAYAIEYDKERTLSWNLLNYYTTRDGAIKSRFTKFSTAIGLGEWKEGVFSGDTEAFRRNMINQVVNVAMKLYAENGGAEQAGNMVNAGDSNADYQKYQAVANLLVGHFMDGMNLRLSLELHQPSILSWNRLEARPRTKDLSRAMRAEVRDPLWFISRQWQIGEFEAEDTGSSVEMRVDMETVPINRYSLRKAAAKAYDGTVPIEAIVEREMVDFDLTVSQEMGRHWEKLVRRHMSTTPAFSSGDIQDVVDDFKANLALQFVLPTPVASHPDVYGDAVLLGIYAAIGNGRMLNGGALYTLLSTGTLAHSLLTSPPTGVNARLALAKTDFLAWFSKVYNQPVSPSDDAWAPSQLEYQAQFSAPKTTSSRTVLTADEYAQGRMDWYSFDIETNSAKSHSSLRSIGSDSNLISRRTMTVLPGDLRFPGMPLPRWWEFEDWKVNLGNIVSDTTDLPKLLQTEFALIYSNDWMLLPHDVKVGSICDIKSVVVRDVFGQYTQIQAAGAGDNTDWQRWSMYNLHRRGLTSGPADTRIFVPPAVIKTMESEALEKVTFLRDEMANMVWGIESIVPDGKGGGTEGTEAATKLYRFLESIAPPPPFVAPPVANTAEIEYKLGTSVPENWIPFIPVRKGSVTSRQIQLRRAAMPRLIPGVTPERIRPRTDLLKEGYDPTGPTWNAYFIYEEEIPRSGAIVTRNWQRVRGMDGAVYTWLGRHKQNGRGEVNSGLEYDVIQDREV